MKLYHQSGEYLKLFQPNHPLGRMFQKVKITPWYCWWCRNPIPNHLGCCCNPVNNRINYQPQLVSLPDFWTINSISDMSEFCLKRFNSYLWDLVGSKWFKWMAWFSSCALAIHQVGVGSNVHWLGSVLLCWPAQILSCQFYPGDILRVGEFIYNMKKTSPPEN